MLRKTSPLSSCFFINKVSIPSMQMIITYTRLTFLVLGERIGQTTQQNEDERKDVVVRASVFVEQMMVFCTSVIGI